MKLLKQSVKSDMLDIYECNECHKPEYYGMFHWHDGHQYCRNCIYHIWSTDSCKSAEHKEEVAAAKENRKPVFDNLSYWRPTEEDLVFPVYSDGVDYSAKEEEYRES